MIFEMVNSSILISEIIDRYAIKSQDFVTRTPNWIFDFLKELSAVNSLETSMHRVNFNNNRCILPTFCDSVDMVVINGRKADYNESLYVVDNIVDLNRGVAFDGDPTLGHKNKVESIDTSGEDYKIEGSYISEENAGYPVDGDVTCFYRLSNGWLHTNVTNGFIEIKYKHIPFVFDSELKLEFPLIPNEFNTKEAAIFFILKTLLMRGYIHPILSLKENNPYTNPAQAYDRFLAKARVELNRSNRDAREKWHRPLASLFGKRRQYYIPIEGEVTENTVTNNISESTPYGTRLAIAIGQVYENPLTVPISFNSPITLNVPIASGFNYFFISAPLNNRISVRNSLNMDVTSEFENVGIDTVIGYVDNTIYRMKNQFFTGVANSFTLTLI